MSKIQKCDEPKIGQKISIREPATENFDESINYTQNHRLVRNFGRRPSDRDFLSYFWFVALLEFGHLIHKGLTHLMVGQASKSNTLEPTWWLLTLLMLGVHLTILDKKFYGKNMLKILNQMGADRINWRIDKWYPKSSTCQKFRSEVFWSRIFGVFSL